MHKALALYSGGLDSLLSVIIVKEQKIDVIALKFFTGFVSHLKKEDLEYAKTFNFEIKEIDIREKFIEILKKPEHGYGKNLNPCIDCKILMLKEAKNLMPKYGASFIVTGEVVSQRPMSQKRELLRHIEKKASLEGLILRPLCAKILPPTRAEIEGIINRDLLYDIRGRTRKPQIALAKKYGIQKIPQPAGGCLLTDPTFCKKVKDLIVHNELTVSNIELLKLGRHLRISEKCKIVVGRNERENEILLSKDIDVFLYPSDFKGPVVLLCGEYSEDEINKAASICVYYSKRKNAEILIKSKTNQYKKIYNAISEQEIVKYKL
ncbi:MAG: tRNA 4-thiouridine(8) synthase ThiI [Thermodesulfovibrio sp.]